MATTAQNKMVESAATTSEQQETGKSTGPAKSTGTKGRGRPKLPRDANGDIIHPSGKSTKPKPPAAVANKVPGKRGRKPGSGLKKTTNVDKSPTRKPERGEDGDDEEKDEEGEQLSDIDEDKETEYKPQQKSSPEKQKAATKAGKSSSPTAGRKGRGRPPKNAGSGVSKALQSYLVEDAKTSTATTNGTKKSSRIDDDENSGQESSATDSESEQQQNGGSPTKREKTDDDGGKKNGTKASTTKTQSASSTSKGTAANAGDKKKGRGRPPLPRDANGEIIGKKQSAAGGKKGSDSATATAAAGSGSNFSDAGEGDEE